MLSHRVIPCLLLSGDHLVKTLKFKDSTYIGDPVNAIRIFNEKEVDELLVLDIQASKRAREPAYDLIKSFASECFMPLAYGGGIRTVDQARRLFSAGVEKISIQTGALKDLDLISEVASRYGNQSVIVSVDVRRGWLGRYRLWSAARKKALKRDWKEFIDEAVCAGAGEILLNAVHKDGTMTGMDLSLIETAASHCPVPLIACGGVGRLEHIRAGVQAGASAVAAGAFFVYYGRYRAVLITYPKYGDLITLFDR